MGEGKRRFDRLTPKQQAALLVTRKLASEGKMIEGGWAAYRLLFLSADAPAEEVLKHKLAFMGGAEHLWSSIFATLDPGSEPTAGDMKRLDSVQRELDAWRAEMAAMEKTPATDTPN